MRLNEAKTVDQMIDAEIAAGRCEFRQVAMLAVAEMTAAWIHENPGLAAAAVLTAMQKLGTVDRLGDLIVRRLLDPSVARIKETELISGIVTAILPPIHNDLAARLAARVTERAA